MVGAEDPAESGDVADGHPAFPQQAMRCGLQGVGDQLDVVHEPVRGPDGGAVDQRRVTDPTGHRRCGAGHGLDAEPPVAEVPGDLAGQQDRVRSGRPQQPPRQQLLHRRPSPFDGDGPVGAVDRAGGVPQQSIDHGARLRPGLGEPTVDLGVGERAGGGRCETPWVRAQVVPDGADQVQLRVVAPEQSPVAEVGDGSGTGLGIGVQQLGHGGQGHRVREGGECFGDHALPRVQSVERPAHGARGGGLGRQVGDVSGDRVGQIRAQREEPGEGVGVEPSECLGQRAGTGDGRRDAGSGSVTVSGC